MSQRFEGRNLEEALQQASESFGVDRWQLTYHVLLEKRGFLGGMKRVVIEAEVNSDAPAPAEPVLTTPLHDSRPMPPRERGGRGGRGGGGGGRGRGGRREESSHDRGGRRGGRGRGRREDDFQSGDFERHFEPTVPADLPEQGEQSANAKLVSDWCSEVLSLAKIDAVVRTEENDTQIVVRIFGRDTQRLTDHHGELLDAIQVLANKALTGRKVEKEIELDTEQFKDKRTEDLGQRAREAADRVRNGGDEELLPAMTPIERRIVHLALQEDADVTTESRGDGFYKRVAIVRRAAATAPPAQES